MNKKISTRLVVGFMILTTFSSLVTGIVYLNIFYQSHFDAKVESLLAYAKQLESHYEQVYNQTLQSRSMDEEQVIELYDQLLDARIWVLRKDQVPMVSKGHHRGTGQGTGSCNTMDACEIKSYDNEFIQGVMKGNELISKSNNEFYYGKTLSVGVPIWVDGKVSGAVLIHAPMDTIYEPIVRASKYLGVGVIASVLLTMVVAFVYAKDFTKPIRQMKEMAQHLREGSYRVSTGIHRPDEIGELSEALDVLAIRLEEAREEGIKLEQMRKDFITNVSHEFRTPLTIIKGNTEGLIDGAINESQQAYDNILREAVILERLVTDLLDLSRLQQGQLQLDLEPIAIHEVIRDAARSMRQVANLKGISIALELEPYGEPIEGDYLRLRQVLMILLDNGVKYTPEGGCIVIGFRVGTRLEVTIEDNGIGIAEEELPYIWDRFYKVDKARKVGTSSGIGLAIAKSLMELLQIEVKVESTLGKGTRVTLWLD